MILDILRRIFSWGESNTRPAGAPQPTSQKTQGIDRVKLRLAVFAALVVAAFVALFSRLWFLQVLASTDYQQLAKENRVRIVHTEPPRGRILDRNGKVLVKNRESLTATVDRQVVDTRRKRRKVLRRLHEELHVRMKDLKERLNSTTVSPYKPVPVANDISKKDATYIIANQQRFPGVDVDSLPVREYPTQLAPQILGYVNQITPSELKLEHFKGAHPAYAAGDLVGQSGVEYTYDRGLRGTPGMQKVVVNSTGEVVASRRVQDEQPGNDLLLSIDDRIQKLTEDALYNGIVAARGAGYAAPSGAVVVMDPSNGQVLAMASYPTFDPSVRANGITTNEWNVILGHGTATTDDDTDLNRAIQVGKPPGSTYKAVTAGAAMATGVATPYSYLSCPGAITLPPGGVPGAVTFNNWTSSDMGVMGFSRSLEVSCDTFYYQLGWDMEERYGAANGDGTERFQKYMRRAGFGHPTGVDLPFEAAGRVPDNKWCNAAYEATKNDPYPTCAGGWQPGYTVNMAIGQGDLIVTPLQMAVTYAAIANGGKVYAPRVAYAFGRTDENGDEKVVREIKPRVENTLGLDDAELSVIRQGLIEVVSGAEGTANSAFAGFPLGEFPVAGKTGTAQMGSLTSGLNSAWFESYAPADDPRYAISVFIDKAGHGGESAAPVARQIYEGIFKLDKSTNVNLGSDASG